MLQVRPALGKQTPRRQTIEDIRRHHVGTEAAGLGSEGGSPCRAVEDRAAPEQGFVQIEHPGVLLIRTADERDPVEVETAYTHAWPP